MNRLQHDGVVLCVAVTDTDHKARFCLTTFVSVSVSLSGLNGLCSVAEQTPLVWRQHITLCCESICAAIQKYESLFIERDFICFPYKRNDG